MAGRPREFSDAETKRRRANYQKERRTQSVCLGQAIDDWKRLKAEMMMETDEKVAKLLLERYHKSQIRTNKRRRVAGTSTPVGSDSEASELSAVSSVKASSIPEMYCPESLSDFSVEEDRPKSKSRSKRTISISAEELDDFSGNNEMDDPDDATYLPSDWEISINIPSPENILDAPIENDISADIHDINLDNNDEIGGAEVKCKGPGMRHIKALQLEDEDDPMFMVSRSSLSFLTDFVPYTLCTKQRCRQPVQIKERKVGTGLILRWVCQNNHEILSWSSQPFLPNFTMLGNFKFSAAIVLSGNNYRKIALMCQFLKIGIPSKTSFERVQRNYVVPEVDKYWNTIKQSAQEKGRAVDVIVAGDGRMDSPGHSAKYCTYTVMDQSDKDIIAMEIVDKRECLLNSTLMEAVGFKKAINDLRDQAGLDVVEVVTDAHPQIGKIMRTDYPNIKHSWDMWHGAKNLGKKLCSAAMEKGNGKLKPWISHITNHFFYSAENCDGSEMLLKVKLFSVMNHCVNRHTWALGECDHEQLDEDEARSKDWLSASGPEIVALEKVITDRRFLNTLNHYVTCQTTSELESFNNHLLMYVSKRHAYTFPVYKCRCQIAAIDYMKHKDRELKLNRKGENMYVRYFSKAANRWGFKIAKEKKLYSYIPDLIYQILSQFSTCYKERPLYTEGIIQEDDPRRLAETIAPTEPVSTKELVSQRHSRLKTSWPQSGKSKENESSEESFAGEEDNKNSQFEIRNNDDDYDDRDDNDDAI